MPIVLDKEEKASRIAEAALTVFLDQGFHRTKMADIAVAAKVGKGTLYEYFDSKFDLLKRIFVEHLRLFKADQLQSTQTEGRPSDRLYALINLLIEHLVDWERIGALFVDYYSVARTDDEFLGLFVNIYDETLGFLTDLIEQSQEAGEFRPDIDADSAAKMIMCFFDGLILYGGVTGRRTEAQRHALTFLQLFKDSMEPRK